MHQQQLKAKTLIRKEVKNRYRRFKEDKREIEMTNRCEKNIFQNIDNPYILEF